LGDKGWVDIEWHQINHERRVSLVILSFEELALNWWTPLVHDLRSCHELQFQYGNVLRDILRKRNVSSYYYREFMNKLRNSNDEWWIILMCKKSSLFWGTQKNNALSSFFYFSLSFSFSLYFSCCFLGVSLILRESPLFCNPSGKKKTCQGILS